MVIAIDVDEVLFPLKKEFYNYLNEKFIIDLDPETNNYDLAVEIGLSYETRTKLYYDFVEKGCFSFMKPLEGAVEGIKNLKKLDDLFAVTSRQNFTEKATKYNIEKYFPKMFSGICFGNYHNLSDQNRISKKELCDAMNAKLLIEDQLVHVRDLNSEIPVILFDKPWNQNFEAENVYRAKNWNQIVEYSKKILNPSFQS